MTDWEKEFDEYWFTSKERTKESTNAHRYEVKVFIRKTIAESNVVLLEEIEKEFIKNEGSHPTFISCYRMMKKLSDLKSQLSQKEVK